MLNIWQKPDLTAPVGAIQKTVRQDQFTCRMLVRKECELLPTANKHILVRSVRSRIYDRLYPVQRGVALVTASVNRSQCSRCGRRTGKQPLASGSSSLTGTSRSVARGGTVWAGGMMTSS